MKNHRLIRLGAYAAAITWLGLALAQSNDPGQMARNLGAQGNQNASQATNQPASSYPGFTTANPPQTQYYNSGSAIQTQAQQALATAPSNDPAVVVVKQATSGPQFAIAPNDPILTQGQTISSQATTLTQSYSGCQALTVGSPNTEQYATKTCSVNESPATVSCNNQLTANCPSGSTSLGLTLDSISSDMAWIYNYPTLQLGQFGNSASNNPWTGWCTIFDRTTTFTIPDVTLVDQFILTTASHDDYMWVELNGHQIYAGPYGGNMLAVVNGAVQYDTSGKTGPCELSTDWVFHPNTDVKSYLVTGTNTIHTIVEVAGTGHGYMYFTATQYPDCSQYDQWNLNCPSGQSTTGCTLETSVCTDGPSTKTVNGIPQTRDCWNYVQTYLCESAQQQSLAACDNYVQQGCQQTGSTCTAFTNTGACATYQQTYRCPTKAGTTNSVTMCGGDLYCPNGNCTSDVSSAAQSPATTTQMATASTWLQAAQNAANDNNISSGTVSFFGGSSMQCTESAVGFSDCCSASGWGISVGLSSCSDEEKTLGQAREAGEAHEIGSYQTGSFVLKTTYDVFCVFHSMLSRIIQEQGRQQLGMSFGTPTSPDCSALTQAQMQALDFNKMDFSEFYAQAEAQANTAMANMPTQQAIQQQLEQQLTYLMQNPGATGGSQGTSGP